MAENEVVFRQYNESVQDGFDNLKKIAEEDGQKYAYGHDDTLHFYCECSDENCKKRVMLRPSRYSEIHKNRNRFVIIPHHEVDTIEHVVGKETEFWIVEKFMDPPKTAQKLNRTGITNA